MPQPTAVEATTGYRIRIRYDDGVEGTIDLCPDAMYMRLTGKSPDEVFPAMR